MLARKEEENLAARASTSRSHKWDHIPDVVWNRIWSIQSLPKIKALLWRSCNEALATGAGLQARHVNIDPSCSKCGFQPENGDHILFDCPFARNVWFGSPLQFSPPERPSLVDWIYSWNVWFKQDKKMAREAISKASFICWYLWRARNEQVFNGKTWDPSDVLQMADKAFVEFSNAVRFSGGASNSSSVGLGNDSSHRCSFWTPLPMGSVKANCDAAFTAETSRGGLGIIFRDHSGALVKARSIPIVLGSIIQGELLAIRDALLLALELGYDNLVVESDSLDAILFVEGSKSPGWEVEDLVVDVTTLRTSFSSVIFSFVPRAMNCVSDALARKALSIGYMTDWPNSIRWLQDLCVIDATGCTHPSHQ
ncbi:uncharacterized protein LOC122672128 [Telopea speciosissima]|uniref:uncharacterized protein LOC122672128 n=1 Tax=Telopea speciosissima TaxID=54955 RepID=UPI001CC3C46D|nr:uncharacterized protein LOC122672128 [Telopea speciosissima]